ncbi:hypothetical protein FEZ18_14250 [Oceanihabitans sp. IOP_32]|uniref:hypothetical protein n=1 Tax=Oceanihabitans sp. IOP_32 TaxID=2529032 RepID=UPI0012933F30|nr:hypothetical protein [Oceanihabitans sp. IOP_32]QFZ55882.1 hypothetical protein FEZ18_14250 [Oceanihabitans sp. IOP_32]
MQDIQITTLTKDTLKEALDQNLYWKENNKVVPFSKKKAHWLLQNERIESNDVCAILAYQNDTLIAFIFLVPDYIQTQQGLEKIFWSTRWWVHSKYENSVLSTYTKKLSLDAVKSKVLIKHIDINTLEYYKKQSFKEFAKRDKYIFVFSLDYNLIVNKISSLRTVAPLLKIVTKLSYAAVASVNKLKLNKFSKKLTYQYFDTLDSSAWDFIKKHCENDLIPKSKAYINWQIDNQQYLKTSATNKAPYKCLLSSVSHNIYNSNFLVVKENKKIGFISALIRADEFVLRYFLCKKEDYDLCLTAVMHHFIKSKCTYILTDNTDLGKQIQKQYICVYTNKKQQYSLAHHAINYNFTSALIQDQDGNFS